MEADVKRQRHCEATYDHDPQLPGDKSVTTAINARLWSEARGKSKVAMKESEQNEAKRKRTSPTQGKRRLEDVNETAIKEGMQSDKFVVRTRGASSEQISKFQRGTAGRIHRDEMQAIHRILKPCIATSSSSSTSNLNVVRCSSEEGRGSFLKTLS